MSTRRSRAQQKPVATPDQLLEGVSEFLKSMQKSDSAAQSTPVIVAEKSGGENITTSEIGETGHLASGVINQSPILSEIKVLMQAMFPGGVTVENLLKIKKSRMTAKWLKSTFLTSSRKISVRGAQ